MSEQDYLNSDIKICIVLKEVNDPDGGGWDLREFLANGARPQTWNNIVRWVRGIRNIECDIPWKDLEHISEEERKSTLKSICAINLKKTPGTHTTDTASLNKVANEDSNYIERQFLLYNPDITICGGTGDLFKGIAGFCEFEWKRTNRGVWWCERAPKKYVIAYCHPEARVDNPLIVYGLIDAIREIYS
ncbi:hypothetical protein L4D04_20355 [Photobacterium angustum]|uniref:Uracil-DNA glycosylase-like domain-containing protein n=1 Tax=Photobacterium angustum (strain S14 / CCUG 15956) TaxID=314292 RepID=Q1ZMV7_PHOAS|nr:hypothetical protein [Photobacterium angustum]EAS63581.1 hypothetical protein VAS14_08915 [Vibrio angustum S14] [Photobacterium angustum S14]